MDFLKLCGSVIWTSIMIMVAIKTMFVTEVQPLKISGPLSNYTWLLERIWLMGTNFTQTKYKNRIPGIKKYEKRYTSFMNRRLSDKDIHELLNSKNSDKIYLKLFDETDNSHEKLNTNDDIRLFEIDNGKLKDIKLKNETVDKLLEQIKDEYDKLDRDESESQSNDINIFEITKYDNTLHNNKVTSNNAKQHYLHKNAAKSDNTLGKTEIDGSSTFNNAFDSDYFMEFIINRYGKSVKRRNSNKPSTDQPAPANQRPKSADLKVSNRAKIRAEKLLRSQQKQKRELIMKFLETNYLSTNYFFNEMKRIIQTRVVQDDLRLMVEDLDKEHNKRMRVMVYKFYKNLLKKRERNERGKNFYRHNLNNLIIPIAHNAFEDGEI